MNCVIICKMRSALWITTRIVLVIKSDTCGHMNVGMIIIITLVWINVVINGGSFIDFTLFYIHHYYSYENSWHDDWKVLKKKLNILTRIIANFLDYVFNGSDSVTHSFWF